MNTDGNLYALDQHIKQLEDEIAREYAIFDKADEVKETLLSVTHAYEDAFVTDSQGNKIELADFIADMEVNDGLFAEFLGGGYLLKDKLNSQFDEFCENIATDLIDNMEPEQYEDY